MLALLSLYGVPAEAATAVALVDFVISTLSVIVIGGIVYAFSRQGAPRARSAHGGRPGYGLEPAARIGTFGHWRPTLATAILRLLGRTTGALSR